MAARYSLMAKCTRNHWSLSTIIPDTLAQSGCFVSVQTSRLLSIATAVPPNVIYQKDVAAAAITIFSGRYREFDRLARVFDTAGIIKRHSVCPIEWFLEPRGWQ